MALIYVVEDDENIREIESFALKNSGYRVTDFSNGKEFYRKAVEKVPDLVLLDIMLPDIDGLTLVQKLRGRAETKKVPIILVTAKTSEMDKVKGLDTGADDYISKPFGVLELISRVKAVLRRSDSAGDDTVITNGSIELNVEKHVVSYDGNNIELTYKEFELLRVLMKNAGNVMTREILMDRVWGTSYEGESRTLDMHIKTLRKKLGEDGGKLIKTVRNVGYKFQS